MTSLRGLRHSALWEFGVRLVRRFRASYLTMLAAALAYYAAFSLGPLLLLLGGWLAVILQTRPELAGRYRLVLADLVNQVMPLQENTSEVVSRNFETILNQLSEGALLRTVLSLLILIWAASGFFTSLQLALEVIFDVSETRSFLRRRLVAVLLVVAVALVIGVEIVGGALLSSLSQVSDLIASRMQVPDVELPNLVPLWFTRASSMVLRLAVAALAFTLAFRFLPRRSSSWTGALVGGSFSSVTIAVTRELLLLTFDTDRFNVIYGVITSVVVTLLWLYLALLMFLVGALITAEISAWRRERPGVPHETTGLGRIHEPED
ncbi:MAG TPA: YhjD/YihY/BrkB family envelope integrity protein [Trueperaceae bacterium]